MKIKSILLTALATLGLTSATMAQVPNYVPANGLVGWWPFNGNANDESLNGNNGTVNGATLTNDRFGNANSAFSFDGINDWIVVPDNNSLDITQELTLSAWINLSSINSFNCIISKDINATDEGYRLDILNNKLRMIKTNSSNSQGNTVIDENFWIHTLVTFKNDTVNFYLNGESDGTFFAQGSITPTLNNLTFGVQNQVSTLQYVNGALDDIGIWNRALTQEEITDLYNAVNCFDNTEITPQINSLAAGSTVTFTASTSDPNPSYVWQSDLGQGFQTLNNFGNYSGVNTASLNIANVQLSEHNHPIRVITTSGDCIDTSNVALINILDTCITNVTIYDTLLTAVTDTLIINATITGINPPNNLNTLKVFPNPANTHITIDYGNFNAMSGYTLNIVNSVGQTVFTTPINQQTSYIDLSTWTGNGIYFVQLIDPQNNTIDNRKILIQ
jgi:hypothetical protein